MSEEEKLSPSSLFLSQISQFYSLTLSHPLYLSYFLFFSPYLFKFLSFLSPLFTTTFLLILALLFTFSHSHQNQDDQFPLDLEWFNSLFNTSSGIPINPFPVPLEEVLEEPEIKKEINPVLPHGSKDETEDDHDVSSKEGEMGMNYKKSLLGCKVFEDENKMDLLWEKYEEEESTNMEKLVVEDNNENSSKSKKNDLRSLVNHQKEMEEEEENGKICCLQALKFSTGKMRFGMGKKSGLRRISKALKGLKLLHQFGNKGKNKTHS